MLLKDGDVISTKASFHPPVEITVTAKVDQKNLIIGYAADQITFNWDGPEPTQLRVEGGPAAHRHKTGAGLIPTNRYVNFRLVVTASRQQIFVDKGGRYSHDGDYSTINRPIRDFAAGQRIDNSLDHTLDVQLVGKTRGWRATVPRI